MELGNWFNSLTGGASLRDAAETSGVSKSTLSRNLDSGKMAPETVIALCRGYNRSPVTGLIETGYLQKWETDGVGIPYALEKATNQQILDEILRRSDPEARELFGNTGHENETVGLAPVTELPAPDVPRMSTPTDMPEGVPADSSPFHEEENTEFDD